MHQQNKNTGGWEFQSGDSGNSSLEESGKDRSEPEEEVSWFREHFKSVSALTAVVLSIMLFLLFYPDSSSTQMNGVPGGEIELIEKEKLDEWIDVTEELSRRLKKEDRTIKPAGTLFGYYGQLGSRDDLNRLVTAICRDELITFTEYREITHELALTLSFQRMKKRSVNNEKNKLENVSDEKLKRVQKNLDVLSETYSNSDFDRYTRFKEVWNALQDQNLKTSGSEGPTKVNRI